MMEGRVEEENTFDDVGGRHTRPVNGGAKRWDVHKCPVIGGAKRWDVRKRNEFCLGCNFQVNHWNAVMIGMSSDLPLRSVTSIAVRCNFSQHSCGARPTRGMSI